MLNTEKLCIVWEHEFVYCRFAPEKAVNFLRIDFYIPLLFSHFYGDSDVHNFTHLATGRDFGASLEWAKDRVSPRVITVIFVCFWF